MNIKNMEIKYKPITMKLNSPGDDLDVLSLES